MTDGAVKVDVLSTMQEYTYIGNLVKDVKRVLTINDNILKDQIHYWITTKPFSDANQRNRIKKAIELHCRTPVVWIMDDTAAFQLEIVIDPGKRYLGTHAAKQLNI